MTGTDASRFTVGVFQDLTWAQNGLAALVRAGLLRESLSVLVIASPEATALIEQLLAGLVVCACAQTALTPTAAGASVPGMTKCWDTAMARVLTETTPAPRSTAGSSSSNAAGSATAQTRPAEARGLPDCHY